MDELLCLDATFPGRLAAPALAPALDALVDNAWGPLTEHCADAPGPLAWQAYDRAATHAILDRDRRALYLRERDGDGAIEAQAWNHLVDTSAILYVPAARTAPDDPRLRAQLARLVAALPPGGYGSIFSTAAPEHVRTEVPQPLHRAVWLAALPVASYQRWITRDELRAAPGVTVDETADGTVWLQLSGASYVAAPAVVDALQTYLAVRARW